MLGGTWALDSTSALWRLMLFWWMSNRKRFVGLMVLVYDNVSRTSELLHITTVTKLVGIYIAEEHKISVHGVLRLILPYSPV